MVVAGAVYFLCLISFIVAYKFFMDWRRVQFGEVLSWEIYLKYFVGYGSIHIFEDVLQLSHELTVNPIWVTALKYWWTFSIKFFIPWLLWQMLLIFDIGIIYGKSG